MNQRSIELLSSEELENITGGGFAKQAKGFGKGVLKTLSSPVLNCIPEGESGIKKYGKFDTDNIGKSSGNAVAGLAVASFAIYGVYKAVRSLIEDKKAQ